MLKRRARPLRGDGRPFCGEHHRNIASHDDRRSVLDDAAALLLRIDAVVGRFFVDIDEIGYDFPASLASLLSNVTHVEARLTIRLGEDHPATAKFRAATEAIE